MELDKLLNRYNQPKAKAPNSPRAEQVNLISELTNKPFKQILGLTRHLSPEQMFWLYKEAKGSPKLWWYIYQTKYMKDNIYDEVKDKLIKFPVFRERKNRPEFIAKLALRALKLEDAYKTRNLTLLELSQFAIKYATYERSWRAVLEKDENAYLRGSDFEDKALLEKQTLNKIRTWK